MVKETAPDGAVHAAVTSHRSVSGQWAPRGKAGVQVRDLGTGVGGVRPQDPLPTGPASNPVLHSRLWA